MYQTMCSPHVLVNFPIPLSSETIFSTSTSSSGSNFSSSLTTLTSDENLTSPKPIFKIDMAPLRSHSTMPPPPHIYLNNNNNSLNKNYNNRNRNNKSKDDVKNTEKLNGGKPVEQKKLNRSNKSNEINGETKNFSEGGDYLRSSISRRSYDSDESSSKSYSPDFEYKNGLKRFNYLYGSQNGFDLYDHFYPPLNGANYNSNRYHQQQYSNVIFYNNNYYYNNQMKKKVQNGNSNSYRNYNSNSRNRRTSTTSISSGYSNKSSGSSNKSRSFSNKMNIQVPPDRWLACVNDIEVRGEPQSLKNGNEWESLSVEIWKKFLANQQTSETFKNKLMMWKELYLKINRDHNARCGLFLVGSTISGFGSNSSDMDMCLLIKSKYEFNIYGYDERLEALAHLASIQNILRNCDFIKKIELIQAKVPILKFSHTKTNVEVDLNCNNSVGIRNTHLLRCYANADWRVKPLVLIVKLWARHHHINDAKNMTISSYSLALMVIHFLQCGATPPVVPCLQGLYQNKFSPHCDIHQIDILNATDEIPAFHSDNAQSLGELFLGFLAYYTYFDYSNYAISVRLGARVPIDECRRHRSIKNDPTQWKLLCIEEPFDLTNTARSVYDSFIFSQIKHVFLESYQQLERTRSLNSLFGHRFLGYGLLQNNHHIR